MEGFEVVRRLGQGSFGSVMKVVRRADGCEYAMKRVPIAQMGDREIADALNECRVLASVSARVPATRQNERPLHEIARSFRYVTHASSGTSTRSSTRIIPCCAS